MKNLNEILGKIQVEFKAKKSRFNSFGKYNFRSAEDILEGLKPMITKYGVYFTVSEEMSEPNWGEGLPIIISKATISNGKESISATAIVGVDLKQKGMQVPQQFGSASSYGKKYALGNLLLIDDTADADAVNTHGKAAPKAKSNKQPLVDIEAAKSYLTSGGSIDTIKKKYDLTPDQINILTNG